MNKQPKIAYIAIGSNLGKREKTIKEALVLINKKKVNKIIDTSSFVETKPSGYSNQPKFINGVTKIYTSLTPKQLLIFLKSIEKKLGRVEAFRNGPRAIDLDILLYGKIKIDKPGLKIPHPRMFKRQFVLKPLKELFEKKYHSKIKNYREIKKILK